MRQNIYEKFKMTLEMKPEHRAIAVEVMKSYLSSPPGQGRHSVSEQEARDQSRVSIIDEMLKPLVAKYLNNQIAVSDFKQQIDSINKRYNNWGFRGIKGQMFFNMLLNTANPDEIDRTLKTALTVPTSEEEAARKLQMFQDYVVRVGQQFVDAGGSPHSKPKAGSVPFFLTYFWQIQQRDTWPVYYTNTVQTIESMNLWEETGNVGEDYLTYKRLHETLSRVFASEAGRTFSLYDVEHVFWFKGGNRLSSVPKSDTSIETNAAKAAQDSVQRHPSVSENSDTLPDSYLPPIISVIPRLALNEPELQDAARRSGTTLERAFEKCINAAFTVLGYETRLLGQGMGRVPDGQATATDDSYVVLWDAKARVDGYRMGTDDRAIKQYIETQTRNMKPGRVRNIYYLIISSSFSDEFDELIRTLKMETNVNEVCLVEASALVAIVDQKLRAPLSISLGPDGIQRLFSASGIITVEDVLKNFA